MTFNHGSEDLRLPEMVYKKVVDKYQDIRDDRDAKAKAFLDGARPYMICQTPAVSGYPRHMGEIRDMFVGPAQVHRRLRLRHSLYGSAFWATAGCT